MSNRLHFRCFISVELIVKLCHVSILLFILWVYLKSKQMNSLIVKPNTKNFSNQWDCVFTLLWGGFLWRGLWSGGSWNLFIFLICRLTLRGALKTQQTVSLELDQGCRIESFPIWQKGKTVYETSCVTHQNSFRHVLPKNKFCSTVCTVCGIFCTEKGGKEKKKKTVNWWKLIIN